MQILKSQIGDSDFVAAVEQYRQALLDHRFTEGQPAPTAHALVEACVRRVAVPGEPDDFVSDFEIVDDTPPPPPEPTLEERKAKLISESRLKEIAVIGALMPAGKLRLFQMDVQIAAMVPEANRSPQQIELLQHWAEYQDQVHQIQYESAKREAAIEDMT